MELGRWKLLGSITGRAQRLLIPLFSVTLNFPSYRDREVVFLSALLLEAALASPYPLSINKDINEPFKNSPPCPSTFRW